jgi:cytochrome c oxidase subunit 2
LDHTHYSPFCGAKPDEQLHLGFGAIPGRGSECRARGSDGDAVRGKFGATNPELEDASAGGEAALGLDPKDPASKDDVVTGTMVVPVNREIEVILRAHDVIHSFFIPTMRFKQDAVPGLAIHMHFTPIETGDYEILCAELCGLGHYKMHGMLKVVSQVEFDKWLAAREAEKQ